MNRANSYPFISKRVINSEQHVTDLKNNYKLMKTKIYTFCSYALIASLIVGCDFLDEDPKSVINSETYYKTESDAVAATNAVYDYMTVGTLGIFDDGFGGIFFNDFWVFKDILSDNCEETINSAEYQDLSEFKFNANNVRIEYYWEDLYRTIFAANVVIDRVPEIDMDPIKRDHLVSEAKFIRALMYFEAVRLFGEVPLLLHETSTIEEATIPRTDVPSIYSAIVEDLQYSSTHLSNGYRVGNGRPVPMACTSLLSKVYLEMGEYQLAADMAEDVIQSGIFELWPDYADIFKLDNMNEGEIIFAANFSGSLSQGFKPNQYHVRLLPSEIYDPVRDEGPQNAWGWERPTNDLLDSYTPLDRREDVTFINSFTYSDGATINFDDHIGKFWDQENEPEGNSTDTDVIYLRYADVLLIYAEALNEVNNGPNSLAYDAINQVRERARFNGTVTNDILPDLSGMNYDQFKDAILLERRWEFVMEGQRFHDLVRMNKLVEKVNSSNKENTTAQPYHELLPIPQRERNLNPNLTQNTGY